MNNHTLITIIIVVYNAERTIANAIDSVLHQTYTNIELVIIDGLSSDKTVSIVKNYTDKVGFFISEKDNGIYDAMNKGIAAAKGEWILFLGADDCLFSTDILENVFSKINYTGIDFLYGNVELSSSKKILGTEKTYEQLLEQNICHQAIFYRRDLFAKKGSFSIRYKILADYHYNLEIFKDNTIAKKYIPKTITLFNDRGVSNNSIDKNFFNDIMPKLVNEDRISLSNSAIQQYIFFQGLCEIDGGAIIKGSKKVFKACIRGKKKLFFFLLFIKYTLSLIGLGRKINFK
jgi:glycosyltransferase involved in cell wall biosynthesis